MSLKLLSKKAKAEKKMETAAMGGTSRVYSLKTDNMCPKCRSPLQRTTSGHGLPLLVCVRDRLALPGVSN